MQVTGAPASQAPSVDAAGGAARPRGAGQTRDEALVIASIAELIGVARAMLRRPAEPFRIGMVVVADDGREMSADDATEAFRDRDPDPDLQAGSRGVPAAEVVARFWAELNKRNAAIDQALAAQASPVVTVDLPGVPDRPGSVTFAPRDIGPDEPTLSPGLVPCPTCATMQRPGEGRMSVHFATAQDMRPCAGSWPARKATA